MTIRKSMLHVILVVGAFFMLFPFVWMIITSLKSPDEVLAIPPVILPAKPEFSNFVDIFTDKPFGTYFFNSAIVTLAVTLLQVFTSALAGYAFARFEFRMKNAIFMIFIGTMMIPMEVTLIPNYFILKNLGWLDRYLALIVPWGASVFGIFLMRQFFMTLPRELLEQAQMEGCSHWQILWYIVFPVSKPVFVSVAIFAILGSWNAFLWPLIMTSSQSMYTLPVGLSVFATEFASRFNLMMAAAVVATLPVLVIYFFAQNYFEEGISANAER
jgi:multiple sugar transport system permease protein